MAIDFEREWTAVSAAPTLFLGATIVVGGLIWVVLHFLYRHRIDGFKEDIERLRHRLGESLKTPPAGNQDRSGQEVDRNEPAPSLPASGEARVANGDADNAEGFEWDDVVDLTPAQVEEFIAGCSLKTVAGLRVIAEHGPVIRASLLGRAGIENYGHFQGRITTRVRTVTGNRNAFMVTWDNWQSEENAGIGHYAVTAKTYRALRIYFKLD